jgi:HEAT repeat protein
MNKKVVWCVGIVSGLVLGVVAYRIAEPYYFSRTAQIARNAGFSDTRVYVDVRDLQKKANAQKRLSKEEVESLRPFLSDKDPRIQARAMGALSHSGQENAVAVIAMVKDKISDKDALIRISALSTLHDMKAPEALEAAKKMQNDIDEDVRGFAKKILASP